MASVPPFEDAEFEDSPELGATDLSTLTQDEIDARAHLYDRNNNLGLQRVLLPEGATKGDAIRVLSKSIPANEYGLPAFFYRSDLLPYDLGHLTQDEADVAQVHLDYEEGFPVFNDGRIFWFQMPHEALEPYLLFKKYLDSVEKAGIRQLQLFSMEEQVSLDRVTELKNEFYWSERCRAYDLFHIAANRKRRELRARSMEDRHYEVANQLMEPLQAKFDDPDFFKNLDAKEALECLRLLVNIQRVSSGLAQNGNAGATQINPDAAKGGQQLMREIAEAAGQQSEGLGLDGNLIALLANPEFARNAQALVIQVRQGDKVGKSEIVRAIADDA